MPRNDNCLDCNNTGVLEWVGDHGHYFDETCSCASKRSRKDHRNPDERD